MTDLLRLRLRAAPAPRDPEASPRPQPARRRQQVVYLNDRWAVRIAVDDGRPVEVMLAALGRGGAPRCEAELVDAGPGLSLLPAVVDRGQFCRSVSKRCWNGREPLVMFGAIETAQHLSGDVRPARAGGLSVGLAGCGAPSKTVGKYRDSWFYARLRVQPREGEDGGAFLAWQPPARGRKTKRSRRGGHIIDMAVVGAALGADASSPAAVARSFGVAWPDLPGSLDLAVAEALAMVEVYQLMLADLEQVAPGLAPHRCWSAGSIITSALQHAGVRAPGDSTATLPRWALGACASAFYGGRVEALLVGVPLPMSMVDLNGTYPATFSLLALTPHLAADRFECEEVPVDEVEALFAPEGFRDRLDSREWWATVGSLFVQVEPHAEPLPCVREAGERWRSVTAPLDVAGGAVWYHAADLVRPVLAGMRPKIVAAFRVVPVGAAPGLRRACRPSGQNCDLGPGDYGQALWQERLLARQIEDPVLRVRRESLAKMLGVSGAWGIFARVDHHQVASPQESVAFGPAGERLVKKDPWVDRSGPLTLWHLASAVPAGCRAIIAMAQHDVEAARGSVAAVLTDCMVVPAAPEARLEPCPGGPHRLPDGREAVCLLSHRELQDILKRFDPLLYPDGGEAWKGEEGSLDRPTAGLVAGLNKVLFGREEGGRSRLVRSSDTSLGDHFADPTGTNKHLQDGRLAWAAELEEMLLAAAVEAGPSAPVRVPKALPRWADLPALRPGRATTMGDLEWLRATVGDPAAPPFAHYVQATFPLGDGPVCLGAGRDPATWRRWDWRHDGKPCHATVQLPDGAYVRSYQLGASGYVVSTVRDVFGAWLREHDPTVGGPERGLRHVLPVRSHPALIELVGRSGEAAGDVATDDPVVYGQARGAEQLLTSASALGSAELARRGVPARTAERVVAGSTTPRPGTVVKLATALVVNPPARHCAGCGAELGGRTGKRWCSDRCRKAVARATRAAAPVPVPTPAGATHSGDLERALDLLASLPGMPSAPLGLRAVKASEKLKGLVEACLGAPGVTPELLVVRVGAEGPVTGRSPVGVLVSRLETLAPALATEAEQLSASRDLGVRNWGHRLGAMVAAGNLDEAAATEELRALEDPGLLRVALDAFGVAWSAARREEVPA